MAFFTTLHYYRPTRPPIVSADALAQFVSLLNGLGMVTSDGPFRLQVKFGAAIDQDDRGTIWEEGSGIVRTVREIEWDIDLLNATKLAQIIETLKGDDRHIYRAHLSLGTPVPGILTPITRQPSSQNQTGLFPDTLGVELGPIEISCLASDEACQVGWMSVSLSGYGYLYPWTFCEVLKRLEQTPDIRRLMEFCRSQWPVDPSSPNWLVRRKRKKLGDLWPYPDLAKPADWFWGLAESG